MATATLNPGIPRASHSFAIARACSLAEEAETVAGAAAACANVKCGAPTLAKNTSVTQRTNRFAQRYFAEGSRRFMGHCSRNKKLQRPCCHKRAQKSFA